MDLKKNRAYSNQEEIFKASLTQHDFNRLSSFITREYGIKLPPEKKVMLQSRLQKRLRTLNISSYKNYIDYVFSEKGRMEEMIHMIDVVTTNKTDFFREANHFAFITEHLLPEFVSERGTYSRLNVWSAGCSTGEEPYTLGMVFSEYAEQQANFDFKIFATDLSSKALKTAIMAIYHEDRVGEMPLSLKKKYLLKSKDKQKRTVRIVPHLRKKVSYQRLNFMDSNYNINENFDLIMCRNVLIYFEREVQEKIINKLSLYLRSGGYFFLGHSESIMGLNVPLEQVCPTVFKRK